MNNQTLFGILACWLAFATADGDAQTGNVPAIPRRDEVVTLSPFEVNTSRDTSYGALNSTSISAFNTPLLKTPVAADIFTEEFMRDVAMTNVEDLLAGYGAGYGASVPLQAGVAAEYGDRNGVPQLGSRGVLAGATRRNGFIASSTNINFNDAFDTERVEVVKGANAMLFGASAAGGFVSVEIRPSATSGYTVENALGASFNGEPRLWVWTNTISF